MSEREPIPAPDDVDLAIRQDAAERQAARARAAAWLREEYGDDDA
jgi:hypothetical protein